MRSWIGIPAVLMLVACAGMPENMAAPPLPKSLTVPPGHRHALTLKAMGSLNYECRAHAGMAGAYGWVLDAPDATLMHWSGAGIGRFYAGPTWSHRDGSRVVGKLVGAAPGREGHLPDQLYEAVASSGKGELSGITYVQRLNAVGAQPRARCDRASAGRGQSVEFSADFLFYRKQ